jgi:hypothetical protein
MDGASVAAVATRVLFLKHNGRKNFVVADAGMNDLIRACGSWEDLVRGEESTPLCLENGGR